MFFEKCKNYLFRSILLGVIFSQVSPSIPQQVVYLVMCTLTLRLFLTIALRILSAHNLWSHLARSRARAH